MLGVDESKEQTRRILAMQRKSHTLTGMMENKDEAEIIFRHRTFQRMLQPYIVVNPFADKLFYDDGCPSSTHYGDLLWQNIQKKVGH